jgi:hypothetical protein
MWEPWRLKGTGESAISVTCWVTDEVAAEEEGDAGAAGRDVWRRQCRGRRGRKSAGPVVLARGKMGCGSRGDRRHRHEGRRGRGSHDGEQEAVSGGERKRRRWREPELWLEVGFGGGSA